MENGVLTFRPLFIFCRERSWII